MQALRGLLVAVLAGTLGTGLARADVLFDLTYGGADVEGGVILTTVPTGVAGEYRTISISGYFEIGNYGSPVAYEVSGLAAVGAYQGNDNLVFYPGPNGAFDGSGVSWTLNDGSSENVSTYLSDGTVGYALTTDVPNLLLGGDYGGQLESVGLTEEMMPPVSTPEPGTMGLVGTGLFGLLRLLGRRR